MKHLTLFILLLFFKQIFAENDFAIELKYGAGYSFMSDFYRYHGSKNDPKYWNNIIMPEFAFVFNNFEIGFAYSYSDMKVLDHSSFSEINSDINQKCFIIDYKKKITTKIICLDIGGNFLLGKTYIENIYGGYSAFTFGIAPYFGLEKLLFKHLDIGIDIGINVMYSNPLESQGIINGNHEYFDDNKTSLNFSGFWFLPRIAFLW